MKSKQSHRDPARVEVRAWYPLGDSCCIVSWWQCYSQTSWRGPRLAWQLTPLYVPCHMYHDISVPCLKMAVISVDSVWPVAISSCDNIHVPGLGTSHSGASSDLMAGRENIKRQKLHRNKHSMPLQTSNHTFLHIVNIIVVSCSNRKELRYLWL